jgi:branched-chain amino acid transport system ATP-binding protein
VNPVNPAAHESPAGSATAATPALAVRGLSVAYGDMVAVHDATFSIAAGEACAITGPNGNGKSSLLMGIAGLVRRRGRVEIFGAVAPSGDVRWAARHGLTLVPERRQLYPGLSALDNIILGCYCWTSSVRRARNSRSFGTAIDLFPESPLIKDGRSLAELALPYRSGCRAAWCRW